MIELCQHDHKYLSICQHYRAVFDTPKIQDEEGRWKEVSKEGVVKWEVIKKYCQNCDKVALPSGMLCLYLTMLQVYLTLEQEHQEMNCV